MNKNKLWIVIIAVVVLATLGWFVFKPKASADEKTKIIHAHIGDIHTTVSTTGTVLPKNRLEVKPPVNGRVDQMLVKEGQQVKVGDIIVLMSSTDRAALLDAARGQGEDKLKYWQEVYKPIPLIAPIDGEVIVGTTQPGQTVTTSDAVVVLSDRLIFRAQVDETDIGHIKEGQNATVTLDAYPDVRIDATVDHIYYESKTINNVTVYEVDLLSKDMPDFLRSGMNTNIEFIQQEKKGVLLLPENAIAQDKGESYVMVNSENGGKPSQRKVKTGISDDKNVEIINGISEDDEIVVKVKKYKLQGANNGTNPFMPARPGGNSKSGRKSS